MERGEIEARILEALYKAKLKGDGWLSIDEIIKDWGEERDRVLRIADVMRREKSPLVKFVATSATMEITEEGIEEYERTHKGK